MLKMVDNGRIALTPAVELSYPSEKMQEVLLDTCEMEDCTPSYSQAVRLRKMAQEGTLTAAEIREIMQQPEANQRDKLVFRADTFAAYFPRGYTARQMEQTILHLLQERQARANTERGDR